MKEARARAESYETTARLRLAFGEKLPIPSGVETNLGAALRATLQHPGSLFRAELAFGIANVYGLGADHGEHLAIALEYFHTASLIFDDLPSMDDALYRRGAPCIHRLYGEGTAILSALALINRAYALAWRSLDGVSPANARLAADYLERHLGLSGILNGQSRDIHFGRQHAPSPTSQQIALEKTVSLIRLPLVLPAMLGGAPAQQRHLLHRLASFWGLGYQALDDLKDVLKLQAETGKTSGRDALLQRPNVALELGVEKTVARLRRLAGIAHHLSERLTHLNPGLSLLQAVGTRFDGETQTVIERAEGAACCFSS